MDAVSSKPKRSMRVATIFTGIAACTVGMAYGGLGYGGAAQAATVKHTPKGIGLANKPAHRISGNIEEIVSCGTNTWLHVESEVYRGSFCFGFRGKSEPTNEVGMYAQCGGNNYGYLSTPTSHRATPFYRGTTYRVLKWPHLDYVVINGWGGTEKCPAVY
jgi:hypothetical protein